MSALVHDEIALAKAQLKQDVKRGAVSGGAFSGAGAVLLFSPADAQLRTRLRHPAPGATGTSRSASCCPFAANVVVAGLLGLIGMAFAKKAKKGKGPQKVAASMKETAGVLQNAKPHPRPDCRTLTSRLWHARPHDGPRHTLGPARLGRTPRRPRRRRGDPPGRRCQRRRFHIAELGEGPLVLLLHGFPQFWWTWRHQLVALADAGFRAVAMDLRGVGGSDRTPRGYDPANLALDVTGVIRSLGEPDAALVGHDLGGYLAWTAATMRPKLVRRLAVTSMPHPRRWRAAMLRDPRQSGGERPHLGLPAALRSRAPADRRRGRAGRAADPRVVGAAVAGRGGARGLPEGHVHPVHGALRGGAVPLAGALAGPAGRLPVQPAHEAPGAGADAASARLPRSRSAHAQRGGLRGVRRGPVPLAPLRRSGALPARGGPRRVLHRADQLAAGPRTGPVRRTIRRDEHPESRAAGEPTSGLPGIREAGRPGGREAGRPGIARRGTSKGPARLRRVTNAPRLVPGRRTPVPPPSHVPGA
ncbi:alpha/beta fold hydrolase [Streptomyces sp. PG2]